MGNLKEKSVKRRQSNKTMVDVAKLNPTIKLQLLLSGKYPKVKLTPSAIAKLRTLTARGMTPATIRLIERLARPSGKASSRRPRHLISPRQPSISVRKLHPSVQAGVGRIRSARKRITPQSLRKNMAADLEHKPIVF